MHSVRLALLAVIAFAALAASTALATAVAPAHSLPIIFFHGVTSNAKAGRNLQQNLSTDARPFIALNFCEDECSVRDLPTQVTMAIAQIRSVVANDTRFANGYMFIGHSQGGILARAVIEEMDDHKVHTFISLAGAQNGNFYGPQANDRIPTQVFLKALGPKVLPKTLIDFANYTDAQVASGKLQIDFINLVNAQPSLQSQLSIANLLRSPIEADFVRVNKFLPVKNNLVSVADSTRRRHNFLRLRAAHFFASPADDVISPWQTSIFGQYQTVASMDELAKSFTGLDVLSMKQTREYRADTYGLRTLDKRGALFLHTVDGVGHSCWVADTTPTGSTKVCKFQPVFEKHVYPLIGPIADASSPTQSQDDYRQQ